MSIGQNVIARGLASFCNLTIMECQLSIWLFLDETIRANNKR